MALSVQAYPFHFFGRKVTTFSVKSGKFSKKVLLLFAISSAVAYVENTSIEVEIALMGEF
jgi:hypothetical protein